MNNPLIKIYAEEFRHIAYEAINDESTEQTETEGMNIDKAIENIIDVCVANSIDEKVCEWKEVGNPEDIQYHYKTSCGHTEYKLPRPLNCLAKFCLFCGGNIRGIK